MREDMEYISGVLDELEGIVGDASGVPMRKGRAAVDRSDLLVMVDELRGALPSDISEAESVRRECDAMIAGAEEEAHRIVEEARQRAESQVEEAEPYIRAQRRASELVERAEHYAEEVARGSEVYRDRVMGQLESWFEDSLASVGESRQELNSAAPARGSGYGSGDGGPSAKRNGSGASAEENGTGEGWQASSA